MAGMGASEIISEVADLLNIDSTKTAEQTRILRWANAAIRDIYNHGDWPELIHINATLITNGSTSYDLTDAGEGKLGVSANFGRIAYGTCRFSVYHLWPMSKERMDTIDPDRSQGGHLSHYCMVNRKTILFWPSGSSGDTITFDWVEFPADITAATTAAEMLFDPDRHNLINEGTLWRGMRKQGKPDWQAQKILFERELKKSFTKSKPVKGGDVAITPIDF